MDVIAPAEKLLDVDALSVHTLDIGERTSSY